MKTVSPPPPRPLRRKAHALLTLGVIGALFAAVSLLPPDTSLSEVKRTGTLTVCIPPSQPPLVTGQPDAPGYAVDTLAAVAKGLGVRISLNINPAIGQNFNPRSWGLNRAQCAVIAGGIAGTTQTQSFLDTVSLPLHTGWAIITSAVPAPDTEKRVGVYAGISGLDRLALTSYLRQQGLRPVPAASPQQLVQAFQTGSTHAIVTEALLAQSLAHNHPEWRLAWLPLAHTPMPLVFGLWKGDLTLKRAVRAQLETLRENGTLKALEEKYAIRTLPADAVFSIEKAHP